MKAEVKKQEVAVIIQIWHLSRWNKPKVVEAVFRLFGCE